MGAAVAYYALRDFVLRKPSATSDRLLTAGFVVFMIGAVGDFVWHEIFGIEVDLEALLSPTHLLLLTGGVLMLSFGARAADQRVDERALSLRRFFPTLMSLTLTAALVTFFTQYFAAHEFQGLYAEGGNLEELFQIHAIGSVFVTNAILLGATLFAVRRWNTPLGSFAFLYGLIAFGVTGMNEFSGVLHVPAAAIAGLVVDLLAARLRPAPDRRGGALAFSMLTPFAIWSAWFGAIQAMDGVHWSAELWTGTIFLAVLEGLGLGLLAFRRSAPAGDPGAVASAAARVESAA